MRQARFPFPAEYGSVTRASRRLLLWFLPATLGVCAAGVFASGFTAALRGRLGEPVDPSAPTPAVAAAAQGLPAPGGSFRIVALGDSLTRGAGDATGGGGYPERVAAALRKPGLVVSVENLGVDGAETGDLLGKVSDPEAQRRIAGAQLILMSIGGNDLSHSIRGAALPSETAGDPTAAALTEASLNLRKILSLVRKANSSSPIRIIGVYDPFPENFDRKLAKETLLKWNVALEEASYGVAGARVVPTADLFDERPDRLSSDRFHPGANGYGEIASRVVSTLPLSSLPASPASTPQKS